MPRRARAAIAAIQHLLVVCGAGVAGMAAGAGVPVNELVYDPAADEACAREQGSPVDPAWRAELTEMLPRLNRLWREEGAAMFEAASVLMRRALAPSPEPVRLTLCAMPSQSFGAGPVVNMRYALKSFTPNPVPERVKIDTAFHESLHKALAPYSPADSQLLQGHASEPACVRNHLHLMALHKAVLLMLDRRQAHDDLVAVDRQLPAGCYRRVWSILNASPEAHMPFVHELAQQPDDRLVLAAQAGDTAALARLLDAGVPVDTRDRRGRTALLAATHANRVEAARLLIQRGADVNAKDELQDSPFLYAGAEGRLEILLLTLAAGADIASTNRYGGTALIPAAHHGHVAVVRELLKTRIDVDHVNRLGWTALLEAIILGDGGPAHAEIVERLVAHGARLDLADAQGVTPLRHAEQRGQQAIAGFLRRAGAR